MRLPWTSQWESAVALESDDPRCCIFSLSAKNYLASRSCPAPSRLCYLLVSSALCSPWFSPEKAYPQYMQSLFRYVRSSPLRHSHRVPVSILTPSSVQPCATRAAQVVFDCSIFCSYCNVRIFLASPPPCLFIIVALCCLVLWYCMHSCDISSLFALLLFSFCHAQTNALLILDAIACIFLEAPLLPFFFYFSSLYA